MDRQLRLDFDRPSLSSAAASKPETPTTVAEIAASLRPRLIDLLRESTEPVGLRQLQTTLGHPAPYLDRDPQSNPVNYLLKEMREKGEVLRHQPEWGEATFTLPTEPPLHEPTSQPDKLETHETLAQVSAEDTPIKPPPLVRPDRQQTFDNLPHYDWPEPQHDRDTITVDRLSNDIDGPPHRFIIQRGDTVEAFFSSKRTDIGKVVGISHAREEVCVQLRDGTGGVWFRVGCIYPAQPDEKPTNRVEESNHGGRDSGPPLSDCPPSSRSFPGGAPPGLRAVEELVGEPSSADYSLPNSSMADNTTTPPAPIPEPVHHEPYTMHAFREYRARHESGQTTLAEHRAEVSRLRATHDAFVAGLIQQYDARQLKGLAARFGCFDARRNTKSKNAEHIYRVLLQSFTLSGSVQYDPMRETLDDAIARQIDGLTEDDWQRHIADRTAEKQQNERALSNPQTLDEYRIFVRERGVEALGDDQRIQFDELLADASRSARHATVADTVTKIDAAEAVDLELTIKEGFHERQQIPLWIVQLSNRVNRPTFNELNRKAKMLGGWYSSFKKADAGFQFKSQDSAEKFMALQHGDVDRTEVLEDRKARKMEKAGDHLNVLAKTLEREAEEILAADAGKLKNTVRRSEMAAGMRGRAYANQAMAGTYRQIASALDSGEAKYLDGVRHGTQVATLVKLLRRGKTNRNRKLLAAEGELGVWDRHRKTEELDQRPIVREDAAFVEYPYPSISRHHFRELLSAGAKTVGLKQISRRMETFAVGDSEKHFIEFIDQSDIELLLEYHGKCREKRLDTRWVDEGLEDYKRMRAANIRTPQELRCALRELVPNLHKRKDDDPVTKAEQALVGMKIAGFFPTPGPVIFRMLEMAAIGEGESVFEPSAGKGDILDRIRQHHPDNPCTAIELNSTLLDVIRAKGHEVQQGNFLEHQGSYDVILMNPPFENGQDIDHVRHAFDQLAPGGRLVAVMSHGPFFRSDRKATAFRQWLAEHGGNHEELPDDAFKGPEAFRQTGVKTQLVYIEQNTGV